MERLAHDFRYSIRSWFRDPSIAIILIATLAFGIGANTAIFSVVNSVLLKPLPFPNPEQVVVLWQPNPAQNTEDGPVSWANFFDWQSQNGVFMALAAYQESIPPPSSSDEPPRPKGATVTLDFFTVLGVQPLIGRTFLKEDEAVGNNRRVVIGYGLWQRQFGGDPDIVGTTWNNRTIIGVMPPGFSYPVKCESWGLTVIPPHMTTRFRNHRIFQVIGRMKPGISISVARAEMESINARLATEYPKDNEGLGISILPVQEQMVKGVRTSILLIWLCALGILLIVLVNVSHVILARAARRQREMAIRIAIGSTRYALFRQLTCESFVIAFVSLFIGLLMAFWGLRLLISAVPYDVPRLSDSVIDFRVLLVSFMISFLAALAINFVQLFSFSHLQVYKELKGSSLAGQRKGVMIRKWLIASEVALATVLLIASGLLLRSFWKLQNVDSGFVATNMIRANYRFPDAVSSNDITKGVALKQVQERVRSIAGVLEVGSIQGFMVDKMNVAINTGLYRVEESSRTGGPETFQALTSMVTPDYFKAAGTPLISGRSFNDSDRADAFEAAIINEYAARNLWGGADPIGKQFVYDAPGQSPITVIGVVGDSRRQGLETPAAYEVYMPQSQGQGYGAELIIRTQSDPAALIPTIRSVLQDSHNNLVVSSIRTMDDIIYDLLSHRRFNMLLVTALAGVAVLLSLVGVYGVLSYLSTMQMKEIGIRVALGARYKDIVALIVRQGMIPVLLGLMLGFFGAFAATRAMSAMLFEITNLDLFTYIATGLLLASIGLAACWIPARRAGSYDPMLALRSE